MSKIPEGLTKCDVCGEYKGKVKGRDINWGVFFKKEAMMKDGVIVEVNCICESTLFCSKCKKNKIHRSMSKRYQEEDNSIWFRPCFASRVPCKECRDNLENN